MNEVLDGWSSPWRAFHKSAATAAPLSKGKQEQALSAGTWLSRARAATGTTRIRPEHTTDH